MKRHILLVGLPGSGKTTIGRLVADRLGTGFIDSDMVIVRKMQMPISHIFASHGESRFRELERETMAQALEGPPSVLAPGGGWAVQPGQLESARTSSYVIYIKTMAMTASKRAGSESTRPILVGEDPIEQMRSLLKAREGFYAMADAEIKNDVKTPEAAADEVIALAREKAGW
ncbi:MAG: shikimate kinase [Gemmatimonadota bacterium]